MQDLRKVNSDDEIGGEIKSIDAQGETIETINVNDFDKDETKQRYRVK